MTDLDILSCANRLLKQHCLIKVTRKAVGCGWRARHYRSGKEAGRVGDTPCTEAVVDSCLDRGPGAA